MTESNTRCGFVALVGRPNVGKSTLTNAMVGEKISIVTPKPQTTRHRILGVRNEGDTQILIVDTPGIRSGRQNLMGQTMNRNADTSIADADLVLFLVDANGGLTKPDMHVLDRVARNTVPCVAVVNKVDVKKAKGGLLPLIQELSGKHEFDAIVPISARTGDNVDALLQVIRDRLPESPWLYPKDQSSDRDLAFRVGELIREKLMMALTEEVPYGLTVEVAKMEDTEEGMEVHATIWVGKDSQKPIVIGKKGHVLKQVGTLARVELKKTLGKPVHLNLWVKIKKNWADHERSLAALGYEVGQ
ncbi:MAG: GTPase Era [Gammaproteobacteria bacterium]